MFVYNVIYPDDLLFFNDLFAAKFSFSVMIVRFVSSLLISVLSFVSESKL